MPLLRAAALCGGFPLPSARAPSLLVSYFLLHGATLSYFESEEGARKAKPKPKVDPRIWPRIRPRIRPHT